MIACFYCGRPLYTRAETKIGSIIDKLIPMVKALDRPIVTLDHIVPRARTKGMPNDRTVPCCGECNHAKRDLTLEEYRVLMAFRYGYISAVEWKFPGEENGSTN